MNEWFEANKMSLFVDKAKYSLFHKSRRSANKITCFKAKLERN